MCLKVFSKDSSIIIDLRTNDGFQEIYTGTSLISILIRGHDFISSRNQKLIPLNYTSRKQNPDIPTLLEEFEKMAISLENNSDQTARTQIYQAHISCNENVLSAAQAPMKSPKASKALPRLSRLCKKLLKGKYEREEIAMRSLIWNLLHMQKKHWNLWWINGHGNKNIVFCDEIRELESHLMRC
ncbi:unnamed protein product [Rhizophagus irregularis]|nr:unnamed protein product [Rhizophagus irregularis]